MRQVGHPPEILIQRHFKPNPPKLQLKTDVSLSAVVPLEVFVYLSCSLLVKASTAVLFLVVGAVGFERWAGDLGGGCCGW